MRRIIKRDYINSHSGFPGGSLCVIKEGRVIYTEDKGYAQVFPEKRALGKEYVFDVASLTKPLSSALIAGRLIDEEILSEETELGDFFKKGNSELLKKSVKELLSHTSGLPSYLPLYKLVPVDQWGSDFSKDSFLKNLLNLKPGKNKRVYSDLGYILLGFIIEHALGRPLKEVFETDIKNVFKGSGKNLEKAFAGGYDGEDVVSTEYCPYEKKLLKGKTHDENARALGGFAGHAGLFSTSLFTTLIANEFINAFYGESKILKRNTAQKMLSEGNPSLENPPMGWDFPEGENSIYGNVPEGTFAHTGYTGCLVVINIELKLSFSLLTNRVHPWRTHHNIEIPRKEIIKEVFRRFAN